MTAFAPSPDQLAAAAAVEAALLTDHGGRGSSQFIRFTCPVRPHSSKLTASYNRATGYWECFACPCHGGATWGETPLGPLVGISPGIEIDHAAIARRRDAIRRESVAAAERKAQALDRYWREHRLERALHEQQAVMDQLEREGVPRDAAEHFGFGWTQYRLHVDDPDGGHHFEPTPALTIPWMVRDELRALQYRLLVDDPDGGRYRWHQGSRATVYNVDVVLDPHDDTVLVTEGAKKTAALWGHGVTSTCAIVSKSAWRTEYVPPFKRFDRVVFLLDPDAWRESREAALTVPNARVAQLPAKCDDLLAATGGDVDLLWSFVEQARLP